MTKVRAAIQESDEVETVLAKRFGVTPKTMKEWQKIKPQLFRTQPYYHPGCDT